MATKGKKGKAKQSVKKSINPEEELIRQDYLRERKNALARKNRLKREFGYNFPENIIPNIPKKITPKSVARLKNITAEFLKRKAINVTKDGSEISVKQFLQIQKEKNLIPRLINLASASATKEIKRRKERFHYDEAQALSLSPLQKGQELYKKFNYINEHYGRDTALDFLKSLSEEDYELFEFGRKVAEGDYSRRETYEESEPEYVSGTGREDREDILQDEGAEYEEDYEDDSAFEPERSGEIESGRSEAEEDIKENLDDKTRRWRENYEREKRKHWKNRHFVSDGEAIYAGILERIRMFESELLIKEFRDSHLPNINYKETFMSMLNDTISSDGFDTVMRRLDGKGYEIDHSLDAMLNDSSEDIRSMAYAQLSEIIKGRAATMEESMRYERAGLEASYDPEDEEVEGIEILE